MKTTEKQQPQDKGKTGAAPAPVEQTQTQAVAPGRQHIELKNKDKGKTGIFELKTKNRKTNKEGTRFVKGEIVEIERGKTIVHIRDESGEVRKVEGEAILDFIPKKTVAPAALAATATTQAQAVETPVEAGAPAPSQTATA